jgi:hypothetical protein
VLVQTRCPSCGAALPASAAWCSLCHADLRPEPEPLTVAMPSSDVLAEQGRTAPAPTARGRHSRDTGPPTEVGGRGVRGKHAAGRAPARPAPPVQESVVPAVDGVGPPDDVEEIADRMLAQLAVTESRDQIPDPESLPGGRWGFAAMLGGALLVLFLVLATIAGFLVNR